MKKYIDSFVNYRFLLSELVKKVLNSNTEDPILELSGRYWSRCVQ